MEANGTFKSYEPLQKLVSEIDLIVPKVYIARCKRLAYRAKQVLLAMKLDVVLLSNSAMQVKMLLFFTCLEDIRTHLLRFTAIDQKLAARISKAGTDQEEFVKLTERLQHCIFELKIPVRANVFDDLEDDEDFKADFTILRAELENYLALMKSDPNENFASIKTRMEKVNTKTKELIVGQKLMKASYKSKRAAEADITIDGKDLKFLRTIGQGGFATVWAGQYKNDVVAIKKIDPETCCSFDEFKKEANIMRRVSHPRTVACYGVAEIEGSFCMVMEYLEHDSVFIWLAKSKYALAHGRHDVMLPDWATKQEIVLDIAYGMAYLHRLRIIHRDLKSPNVLLDNSYRAKVADFGLSVVKSNTSTNMKMDEAGTANYMAPECFGLNAIYSTRSDVYAFSILLWEIVEWEFPFQGMDRYAIKNLVVKDKFRLPLTPKLPVCFSSLITATWAQKPENRPTFKQICQFVENINFNEGFVNINEVFPLVADDLSHKAAVKAISTDLDKFWKKLITLNPQPTWDQFYQLAAVHCGVESSSKLDTARLRKRLDPSSTMKLPSFANIYLVIQDADLKKFFSKYLIDSSTASLKINNGVAEAAGSVNKFLGYVKKKINGDSAIGNREKDKPWTRKQLLILAAIVVVLIILISIIIAVSVANNGSNKQSTQLEVNTLSSSTSNANPAITNTVTTDPSIFPPESQCLSENVNVAIFSGIYGSEGYSDGLLGTGNYKEAVALASPSTGKFYVSDLNRFRQIDSAGTVSLLGSFPSNIRVASIAVGNSSIYVGYMGPSNNNRLIVTVTLNPFRYNYLAGSDTSNPSFRDGLNGAFGSIKTVFYDARHNRLLVSDSVNHLIRAVSFNGEVSTVYGKKRDSNSGGMSDDYNTTAEFKSPDGIAQDSKGNLYIADTGNNLLRKIHLNGYVSTVAGTVGLASSVDGGYGYNTLNSPTGLYVDSCDNVFILETGGKLRMLSPNGRLYTVPFVSPSAARSITGDSTGALFIASTSDEVILKVTFE